MNYSTVPAANPYPRCTEKFTSNVVQTEVPQFMDLGIPAVNTSHEFGIQGTPATRIRRPTAGSHWSAPDHVFGKLPAVGMSSAKSEEDYSYRIDFQIWRENHIFLAPKYLNDSTNFGINSYWYRHDQQNIVTIGINSYLKKTPELTP